MTTNFAAGPHTTALWTQVESIIAEIEALPFLNELAAGTLDPMAFANYITQDGIYLRGYAQAMSQLAAHAEDREESRFWADSAAEAITVEETVQTELLADAHLAEAVQTLRVRAGRMDSGTWPPADEFAASPTTLGYVSYLTAVAANRSYGQGVAGVLPCFWVYAHIGKVLVERAGQMPADHPYRTWVTTYDDPEFAATTRQAVQILERALAAVPETEASRMRAAFVQACIYELHFWASAHVLQDWGTEVFTAALPVG